MTELRAGRWTRVRFRNDSARLHPMHIHGQFFRVLARDGRPVDEPFFRDTVLVRGRETVDVGLVPLPGPGAEPGPLRPLIDDALEHREVVFRPHHDELLFRTRLRLSLQGASVMAVQVLPVRAP